MKMAKITMRGFRPAGRGLKQVFGKLEAEVMQLLWQQPSQTVNEVEEKLRQKREIAHTTVLTTLDRMHRKGYLTREKSGKAFIYAPRYSREEFERGLTQEVLGALLGQFTQPALSTFVDLIAADESRLDELEALIREKRRAQKQRKA